MPFCYEIRTFIAPLNGGDAAEGSVLYGFRLFRDHGDHEVASDYTVDEERCTPTPEELVNAIPLRLFNACPIRQRIAVTNTLGHVWFRFERTDEAMGVRYVDRQGTTIAPPA